MFSVFDIIMRFFLILCGLIFACMMLVVCIVVIKYAIEERKERKRVHALQKRTGRDGNDSGIR
jgi:membrane protein required for beta-lactamase induction